LRHNIRNTYTRLDTENLIEFGRQAPGKDRRISAWPAWTALPPARAGLGRQQHGHLIALVGFRRDQLAHLGK